jgi:hypothetical protein
LERSASEQKALSELALLVASDAPVRDVFRLAAEITSKVLRVPVATLVRFEQREGVLVGSSARDGSEAVPLGTRVPLSGGDPTPVCAGEGAAGLITPVGGQFHPSDAPLHADLSFPVQVDSSLWGTIRIQAADDLRHLADTNEFVSQVANLVALVVSGAEARERLRALASTDHLTGLQNQRAFDEYRH